jgi:hypothetical protein
MFLRKPFVLLFLALGALLPGGPGRAAPAPAPARMPRVLLAASSTTREFQFVRTLLAREEETKRLKLSVYLQAPPGREERREEKANDEDAHRIKTFPDHLAGPAEEGPEKHASNLAFYDLIVAFDLDWRRLPAETLRSLEKWGKQGVGSLVLVAGPVNTPALAKEANAERLTSILALFPVIVAAEPEKPVDATQPGRLVFTKAARERDFLKLNPSGEGPLAGWDEFFGAGEKKGAELRGFFGCQPVKKVKAGAVVLANWTQGDSREPYLVTMKAGKGRVLYLGSGEMWRLRSFHIDYHQQFWTKLVSDLAR